jgi:threonine/homoserine/homoserine lactone efflux protein
LNYIPNVYLFLATVVIISTTGVMMPGPVTAATIAKGYKQKWAGVYIALGHGIVEFPTIALMALGFSKALEESWVAIIVGLAGGAMLLFMGLSMITSRKGVVAKLRETDKESDRDRGKRVKKKTKKKRKKSKYPEDDPFPYHPVIAGVITTASNPYFFLWWATLGAFLTMNALEFGLVVLAIFAVLHWSIDLGWDMFIGWAVNKSKKFWNKKVYIGVFAFCGGVMLLFGIWFIGSAVLMISGA